MPEFVDDGALRGKHGVGLDGMRQTFGIGFGRVPCVKHLGDVEHELAEKAHALVTRIAENLAQRVVEPTKAAFLHFVQGKALLF